MKTSVQMPMAVVAVAIFVASTATVQAEDYLYETNNGTITITGYNGPDGDVNIPDTINGLSVTCIGDYAFGNCVFLTNVTIPDSVTTIGFGAFQACFSLTSATIGAGVTSIGVWAFSGCTSLTSITIPDSVTSIGDYAFSGCTSLTAIDTDPRNPNYSSVNGVLFNKSQTALIACPGGKTGAYVIPDNVTSIGDWAFLHCGSLTSVTIPDSVIIIEDGFVFGGIIGAFCGCTSLTNVNIGNGLTTIAECAFAECTSLTSITIPNSVTNIGGFSFFWCTSLSNVTVPDGVTSIEDLAFYCCTSLTNITIGNSVTSIGHSAFNYCTSLTSITIPNSVTTIKRGAFSYCTGLTTLTVPDTVTTVEAGDETSPGSGAFSCCTSLTNVTIGNGLTNIGYSAFSECTNLSAVFFKGNAPTTGKEVFERTPASIYHLPGTTGWGSTFADHPTALWVLPYPIILTTAPNFGIQTNAFGFRISWATNAFIVVEASTTLANPVWSPVSTNTLTGGWCDFRDAEWMNYPARFYRIAVRE